MARTIRAALVFAFVALVAFGGSTSAADPTLGGRLSPAVMVWENDPHVLTVGNLSTIPAVITLNISGAGWTLDTTSLILEPGAEQAVSVTSAGEPDAIIRATIAPRDAIRGTDTTSLVMETKARHLTPLERLWGSYSPWLYLAAAGLGVLLALAVRGRLGPPRKASA